MRGFFYGAALQWKLDLRSRTMLIACYGVPLLFFAFMGGIFTAILPESKDTLIPSMTVFSVSMGALIGLPPSLAELYQTDIKNAYQANGVPLSFGLIMTTVSAWLHLFLMSCILYVAAPLAFDANLPENPGVHFAGVFLLITVSLSVASIIGLGIKHTADTSLFSILLFLPSIMLSGILFPAELLPTALVRAGKLFPASWGYLFMTKQPTDGRAILPLLVIFLCSSILCALLLKNIRTR